MSAKNVEIGVIFPMKDIGSDRKSLLSFAPKAEDLGLNFIASYDHVVGIDPDRLKGLHGCFTSEDFVHEPLVLFGAMAAMTERIRLVTSVLIAPQRSTPLIAKQAAQVDILSGGRLTLGMAVGWNKPEFEALGYSFEDRAPRMEAQIDQLKKLWTESGTINPLPVQRPIPIWIGGLSEKAVERAARLGDGWIPLGYIDSKMEQRIKVFKGLAQQYGRENLGIMGRINPWAKSKDQCLEELEKWTEQGATHIALGSSQNCFKDSDQYFGQLEQFLGNFRK